MMNNYEGAAVAISGLQVVRGRRDVIPRLDLEIPAGEVVGLLGPSGSGKSTLMRCMVGVQIVKGGTVTVLGHPAGSPELRNEVGYVTQSPSVYADLTVRDNVAYFARAVGLRGSTLREAVDRTLAEVDLVSHADQLIRDLSGGQESRVSLAAALVGRPTLLVLDEPTVGLDPVLRRDLWELFAHLAEVGHSLVVSSHVMDEATRCDRLVLLRDGDVLADLTPAELLARTGAVDADAAFLALIDAEATSDRSAS
jgi:ABC-2 type transport system ATP-binding protein